MIDGPDTKYRMMWGGAWRAVTNMLTHDNHYTNNPSRAAKAVLFVDGDWLATLVSPGDILERDDRDPDDRQWTPIKDD